MEGELVEIIEGIELAHLDDAIVASDIAAEEASWLYTSTGRSSRPEASALPALAGEKAAEPACWLVLADRQGVGAALAEQIRAAGLDAVIMTADAYGTIIGTPKAAMHDSKTSCAS